eukprot:41286-Eustigmatos_ZCMA.PRE.1
MNVKYSSSSVGKKGDDDGRGHTDRANGHTPHDTDSGTARVDTHMRRGREGSNVKAPDAKADDLMTIGDSSGAHNGGVA